MAKVVVAMSGGLDSSVSAALLKRAGFEVIGVFMKFWKAPDDNGLSGGWNRCCSPEAEVRARKVAKILKIPFYVFNFEKEFKKRIVDYFLEGYKKGITPNPCVLCNKEIKFGLLLEKALKLDADYIATGHYARKYELKSQISKLKTTTQKQKVVYQLLRAKDIERDQSYFLWMLNQKQLKRILFPIGDYTRKEVENLARKFKLPVLKARKSVEICFIKTTIHPVKSRRARISSKTKLFNGVNDFLKKYLKKKPGKIIDTRGETIGTHQGLYYYTIGQRKGLGLVSGPAFAKPACRQAGLRAGKPYYVLDKDLKKNLLIVTKNEKDLLKKELICKNVNWISGKAPKFPLKIKAKIRYRHQPASAIVTKNLQPRSYKLEFEKPQRAITPGQSVVFYKGQELLGGGVIC
jgi:tRNA-specific 2-thiouridylase